MAQVNEEIDQARGWLAEMQGRVDFSRVNVQYQSGSPSQGGFTAPIRDAFGSIGSILGMIFAMLIVGLTVLVPLGLIGAGLLTSVSAFAKGFREAQTYNTLLIILPAIPSMLMALR